MRGCCVWEWGFGTFVDIVFEEWGRRNFLCSYDFLRLKLAISKNQVHFFNRVDTFLFLAP